MTNLEFAMKAFGLDKNDPVHIEALNEARVSANRLREFMERQESAFLSSVKMWAERVEPPTT